MPSYMFIQIIWWQIKQSPLLKVDCRYGRCCHLASKKATYILKERQKNRKRAETQCCKTNICFKQNGFFLLYKHLIIVKYYRGPVQREWKPSQTTNIVHLNSYKLHPKYIEKMFTTGQIIFTSLFSLVFIVGMLWAYRKDSFTNKIHFRGASKILWITIFLLLCLFLYVKMRHRL